MAPMCLSGCPYISHSSRQAQDVEHFERSYTRERGSCRDMHACMAATTNGRVQSTCVEIKTWAYVPAQHRTRASHWKNGNKHVQSSSSPTVQNRESIQSLALALGQSVHFFLQVKSSINPSQHQLIQGWKTRFDIYKNHWPDAAPQIDVLHQLGLRLSKRWIEHVIKTLWAWPSIFSA